ncbi:MAG: hypothetical protein F4206_00720 [Gammaproteobacteria bacterium]|nr:hypothetical protein [Gammaproteobacteria bacterium]
MDLTTDWQDANTGLGLVDGTIYRVEFHGPPSTPIRAAHIDGGDSPATDDDAMAHFNRDYNPMVEAPLIFTAIAGRKWWLKTLGGASRVVAEKIGP